MPYVYTSVDQLDKEPPPLPDQWKAKNVISARMISIPPPRQQYYRDGSLMRPSDNALAFYVIER